MSFFKPTCFYLFVMRFTSAILTLSLICQIVLADNIAVFYALDNDLKTLKAVALETGPPSIIGSSSIHRLRIGPHHVYAVKMGSGAVDTALSAQALLTRFRCNIALSIGPAGLLRNSLTLNSWHPVSGVIAWQKVTLTTSGPAAGRASAWMFDWEKLSAISIPSTWKTSPPISLASGEAFVASETERERLHAMTGADAVDMNTFGLAVACQAQGVPLFVWRIISDSADENAAETFREFCKNYDGEGGRLVADLIAALPPNPDSPESYPAIQRLINDGPVSP